MFLKDHFGTIVTIVMTLVMGAIMSITSMFLEGLDKTVWVFIDGWACINLYEIITLLILPASMWGNKLAEALKCKQGGIAFTLVSSIIPAVILTTTCCIGMCSLSIFGNAEIPQASKGSIWINSFVRDWPVMGIVAYISSIFCGKLGVFIAGKMVVQS